MILDNFLLQQNVFRKLLHPEIERLEPLSEIEDWEHVELRDLWFAYIRDRWTYPSNLYFTEAITYFLHGYCHGSKEHPLEDNAPTMVRLDNLWAEFRDSLPFINDDGTLLRAHREASQHAMDDVLTILRAVHGMCEDPSVFNKHADNLGLIGTYRDLPLIWKRHPGNHFYAPGSLGGSTNSDETEILEDGENGDEGEEDGDDDDDYNGHGGDRPRSNRHGNKHHITSRRRSCDLYYDAPSNSQHSPPPALNHAEASHSDRPFADGRRQFEHTGGHGAIENSRIYHSQNQRHYPIETQRRPRENSNQTQHADYRPINQEPLLTRAFHPVETRQDFTDNNNYPDRNHIDHRQDHQAQTQYSYHRPSQYFNQIHTRNDTYQFHRQDDHLNSTHYQSNPQYGQYPNERHGPSHPVAHRNVTHQRGKFQGDSDSSNKQGTFRPQGETRFDGPRPHNDLDQYHLGSDQRSNNHSSSTDLNSPGLCNRYGDRLRGSYGTGVPLPPLELLQNQRNPGVPQTTPTMRHADSNNSGVNLSHGLPLAIAAAADQVPSNESSSGSNPSATTTAMTYNFQSGRFQLEQPDHPRFLSQTVGRRAYYLPVVTARPQGFTTTIATTAHLVTQDLSGPTSASRTSGPGLMPLKGDGHGQVGDDDRDCSSNDVVLERNDGSGYDAGYVNEEGTDNEESEEDADHEENEESSDNDESDNRSNTADYGGSKDDDDGDSSDSNDHDGDKDDCGNSGEAGNSGETGNDHGNNNDNDHHNDNGDSNEENDDNSGQGNGNTQDNNVNEANNERTSYNNSNSYSGRDRLAVGGATPQLSEKNVKDAIASIQPVMTEYGEYLIEKRKALEGPRANLEKRRVALRELKRVAQRVQDQFDERDALATQAKSIDFQFRVCDEEMSKVFVDISMSNTYMSSALKRKRGQ